METNFYIIRNTKEVFRMTEQTRIFSTNLNRFLNETHKSQIEVANAIGVSQQTFNTWSRGIAIPRIDKIQLLANYFGVGKDAFIEDSSQASLPKTPTIYLLGRVAAGSPIFAEDNIVGELDVPTIWAKKDEYYGLTIKGDSMEPKISNGDIVIVHNQEDAESGEIVIATINGDDAVCKRLMKYGDVILLRSFNSNYDDIDVTADQDFRIWGKVIESRHKF